MDEKIKFLKSYDFMRLGQAVHRGQWQAAAMTLRRMEGEVKRLGLTDFERPLAGLRQTILRKDVAGAKQLLSVIVGKRVRLLSQDKNNA